MQDLCTRDPSIDQRPEPLPGNRVSLAPPPKRAIPAPDDLSPKAVQTIHIAGNCKIVEIALYDRFQPFPDLGHRPVPASPKLLLHLSDFRRGTLTGRLSLDAEPAGLPSFPAHVRETQKVEHLRLTLAPLLPVFGCVSPEFNSGASCPGVTPAQTFASGPSIPGETAPRQLDVRTPRRCHLRSGRQSRRP